jgi:pyrroline-5-carboxylate reductase
MTAASTVGVIGVGHLVRHMMPALVTGGHRFILSARNRETAAELSKRFRLEILEDNAEIVARCDIVILAVRPYDAVQVAGGLPWRADMTVLSLCAGVASAELAPAVAPARLVMAIPTVGAEFGESATVMWPDDAPCRALLAPCGPVIALDEERQFAPASVIACYYGWVHELMGAITSWTADRGIPEDAARLLVAQTTRAAATVVRERRETSIPELVADVATPKSFTLLGLEELRRQDAFDLWRNAADTVAGHLSGANEPDAVKPKGS